MRIITDFLIIGSGIVGLSIAYYLKKKYPYKKITIIEKEDDIGFHASGRNSGVLHAGFYYTPDSLKAKFTRQGNEELTKFCEERNLPIKKCGKVVVAKNEKEIDGIFELKKRGDKNGVELHVIDEKELKDIEPNAKTTGYALWSPKTAVVDPVSILRELKKELSNLDVVFLYSTPFKARLYSNEILAGDYIIEYEKLINAAGVYADKIAKEFGLCKDYTLIPFKGLYIEYTGYDKFIKTNIYPVPNLLNPFLGVHFTIKVDGTIKIGPTATPAFWREDYNDFSNFKMDEFIEIIKYDIKMFINKSIFRNTAIEEMKKYFGSYMVKEAAKMVKYMDEKKFNKRGKPGIRPQLVNINSLELVHDFVIEYDKGSVHILNAISPAFTASFPFARYVVENYL